MTKKSFDQIMTYKAELINSIEQDFTFSKKPINRFKIAEIDVEKKNLNKTNQINELKRLINSIQNCNLRDNAKKFIFDDGIIDSPIMVIGESPGIEEEKYDKTFQGETGFLLKKMLMAIDIKRESIYSTYAIHFRPPEDRKPTSKEIKRYSIFLKEHISIINPKIVILMGSSAMEAVTGLNNKITDERGKWKEIILKNKTFPLMVTFSPSYLIRFPENKKYSWEDLKRIKQKIQDLNIVI
jgi:DNA polymerase